MNSRSLGIRPLAATIDAKKYSRFDISEIFSLSLIIKARSGALGFTQFGLLAMNHHVKARISIVFFCPRNSKACSDIKISQATELSFNS